MLRLLLCPILVSLLYRSDSIQTYSGKQLHSNRNSGLLGKLPQQNSGQWMRHPLLKQGNHFTCVVKKNTFKREKTLFSGYPFSCLSGLEKDSWMAQQSNARLIDFVSPAMGHRQDAHPGSNLSVPAITSALGKTKLTSKAMMDLASQDGLVYISGPTYASST
ncbi:hypothetical protein MKX03_031858, partial [Papaver bracteatum]